MIMKKLLILTLLIYLVGILSSCGTFQKITDKVFKKTSETVKANTEKKTDSTGTSTVTVKEKIDTTIKNKADTAKKTEKLTDLTSGKDIEVETGKTEVLVHFD